MELIITGVHQRTTPLAVRERLAFTAAMLPEALRALSDYVAEGFIVSTCNRVEVYGVVASADDQSLCHFLPAWSGLSADEVQLHLYTLTGEDAVRHIFRLASGLDSMVLGEDQIMGQIKTAMAAASEARMLGSALHHLLQSALGVGKLVRTQTGIARTPVSVVSVAFDVARQSFGHASGKRYLVLGAGHMAELALKHLKDDSTVEIQIISRTYERAAALAARYRAVALPFAQLEQALRSSDVVISCTSSTEIVLDAATVARATAGADPSLLLLDVAVPRDIDPAAAALPGVQVCDIDDMQAISEANRTARMTEIVKAETLIEAEVAKFVQWWAAQRVVPTIRALRERAEAIRAAELQRTLDRLPELSPREQQAVQALSAAIVNKLLHQPITSLKDTQRGGDLASAVQQLFQLS